MVESEAKSISDYCDTFARALWSDLFIHEFLSLTHCLSAEQKVS